MYWVPSGRTPHAVERIAWVLEAMGAETFTDPRPGKGCSLVQVVGRSSSLRLPLTGKFLGFGDLLRSHF